MHLSPRLIFGSLALVSVLLFLTFCYQLFLPISSNIDNRPFVVNQGDGLKIISSRLYKNKFTKNEYAFFVYALLTNNSKNIKAGNFQLTPSDNLSQMLAKLTTNANYDYWLKIIDGQRLEEINLPVDPALEGYLFPDSYLIPQDYSPEQILAIIKNNFDKKLSQAKVGATNTKMSDAQIITLASIIEREARTLTSKQNVAGILLNRLKINMALQIDATIQYARDSRHKPKIYWQPVTTADLEIVSPYNTYHNPGLPPAPICNPGYDSIYAALHPIASDNLYYITGHDNLMHYAQTLPEHNTNIAKYLK